jgi:hypothetical protein
VQRSDDRRRSLPALTAPPYRWAGGGASGTHRVLFLVAPTSLIWCCATGARNPSGWASSIRELTQGPSWPTLWTNWWRSTLTCRAQHRVPDLRRACAASLLPAWRCSSPSRPSSSHGSGPRCCSSSARQLNGARQLYREKDWGGSSTARGRIAASLLHPCSARRWGSSSRGGFANANAVGLLETIARRT